jgi:hypothetical protein
LPICRIAEEFPDTVFGNLEYNAGIHGWEGKAKKIVDEKDYKNWM